MTWFWIVLAVVLVLISLWWWWHRRWVASSTPSNALSASAPAGDVDVDRPGH